MIPHTAEAARTDVATRPHTAAGLVHNTGSVFTQNAHAHTHHTYKHTNTHTNITHTAYTEHTDHTHT